MQGKAKSAVILLLGCSRYHVQGCCKPCSKHAPLGELGLEPAALSAHGCTALDSAQAHCGLQVFEVQQAITRGMREAACLVQCNVDI